MIPSGGRRATNEHLRVLLLAAPDVGRALKAALANLSHVELVMPEAEPGQDSNLNWLCRELFSIDPAAAAREDAANFFLWGGYDVVILQDEWLAVESGTVARIELAGRVFAGWDNGRGNFSTRKIVLVTDRSLFARRVRDRLTPDGGDLPDSQLRQVADPKQSILCGSPRIGRGERNRCPKAGAERRRAAGRAASPKWRVGRRGLERPHP